MKRRVPAFFLACVMLVSSGVTAGAEMIGDGQGQMELTEELLLTDEVKDTAVSSENPFSDETVQVNPQDEIVQDEADSYAAAEDEAVRDALSQMLESISRSSDISSGYAEEIAEIAALNGSDAPAADALNTSDMNRLFNPNDGEHFYTASAGERDRLLALGWKFEGIGWKAPVGSNLPVYRLYNPRKGFEEHHYTRDQVEINVLKTQGWNLEGIAWFSDESKRVNVYRLFNPKATSSSSSHHYTTDANERNVLSSQGWRYEGVAWYAVSAGSGATSYDDSAVSQAVVNQINIKVSEIDQHLAKAKAYLGSVNAGNASALYNACKAAESEYNIAASLMKELYGITSKNGRFNDFSPRLQLAFNNVPVLSGNDTASIEKFLNGAASFVDIYNDALYYLKYILTAYTDN